ESQVSGTQTGGLLVAARAACPWWARITIYCSSWLPVFVMFVLDARRFKPIFVKLEDRGVLPQVTHWLMTFEKLNAAYFYVPTLLFAIAMLAIDALVVCYLRPRARGNNLCRLWVTALALAAIPAAIVAQFGLLPPVVRM